MSAILGGRAKPGDAAECLVLAEVCRLKQQHAAAVRFYADAFKADPKLADDPQAHHRYNAACCAALAAAGRGQDAAARAERKQALAWLGADLDAWSRQTIDGNPRDRADAAAALRHWQGDADLRGVRHPWSLLRLPGDERRRWQTLWAEVDELLKKAAKD